MLHVWNIYIPTFTIINIPYMEVLVMISFHEETTPSFFNVKVENHQLNPKTPNWPAYRLRLQCLDCMMLSRPWGDSGAKAPCHLKQPLKKGSRHHQDYTIFSSILVAIPYKPSFVNPRSSKILQSYLGFGGVSLEPLKAFSSGGVLGVQSWHFLSFGGPGCLGLEKLENPLHHQTDESHALNP